MIMFMMSMGIAMSLIGDKTMFNLEQTVARAIKRLNTLGIEVKAGTLEHVKSEIPNTTVSFTKEGFYITPLPNVNDLPILSKVETPTGIKVIPINDWNISDLGPEAFYDPQFKNNYFLLSKGDNYISLRAEFRKSKLTIVFIQPEAVPEYIWARLAKNDGSVLLGN